jgi:hypothetical protein
LPDQFESWRASLLSSARGLSTSNESLTGSLGQSQDQAATSASESEHLRKDLSASTVTITQQGQTIESQAAAIAKQGQDLDKATRDAYLLEAQVAVLRIGCFAFGIGCVGAGVYEGGRALKWWK